MARAEGHIYYNGFFAYSQLDKKTNDNVQYYQTPVLIGNFTTLSYFQTHAETPISTELSSGNGYSLAYRTFVYKASDYIQRTDYLTEGILEPSGTAIASLIGEETTDTVNLDDLGVSYVIEYTVLQWYLEINPTSGAVTRTIRGAYCETFTFLTVENRLPLKKWTCTDVILRLLDLAEPIRKGDKPRFRLEGDNGDGQPYTGQAAQFDTILSPEFAFTKQTLRECLQEVGQVIHGEPRLTPKKDGDGTWYYEVSYDLYGQMKPWKHANRRYFKKNVAYNVNDYATALDTHAENLINKQTDWEGTITEPYAGGAKTTRTENMYVQITETNMLIPTSYPIYTVEDVEWVRNVNGTITSVSLKPYLFESSIYNAQLSSYEDLYPNSKAYALTYTQGEKNITGLSFKPEHPVSEIFQNYAILNVLRAASGDSSLTIEDAVAEGGGYVEGGYPQLCFRVTYTPIYQSRVGQTKPYCPDYARPAAMIYNQQANVIESRAYGENLKGVIARLGNAEKSYTYHLARLQQIPKPGMYFDKDYVISGVYVEYLPTIINATVALTKDFNRISRYVGISSVKRFSQVSQTMAQERNVLYQEYLVIGDYVEPDSDTRMGRSMLLSFATVFSHSVAMNPVSCVVAWGESYSGNYLPAVCLPVIASSFGNSVSFSWQYADNYSAGAVSKFASNGSSNALVQGYYQNDSQYTDYYGRMYYYNFDLRSSWTPFTEDNYLDIATSLPSASASFVPEGFFSTAGGMPYLMRKDSREKLQVNVQVNLVTNRKNMIIGSALASYCAAVRGMSATDAGVARLYILPEPLNKFTDHLESYITQKLADLPYSTVTVDISGVLNNNDGYFTITGTAAASGKAWAIVTPQTTTTEQVEDEEGDVTTQTVTHGGDLLLGENMEISSGEAIPTIYFSKKEEVFDKTVWKDIR